MGLVNLGGSIIADSLIGGTGFVRYNAANAYLVVGNGTAAIDSTQTDLQGVSKAAIPMDVGFPARSSNALTFQGTADGTTANFAIEEWGVKNGATGDLLVRFLQSLGTKAAGTQWKITGTVTFVIPV